MRTGSQLVLRTTQSTLMNMCHRLAPNQARREIFVEKKLHAFEISSLRSRSAAQARQRTNVFFRKIGKFRQNVGVRHSFRPTRSCEGAKPSSFCSFWFAAPLRTVLSCGGAQLSAPLRLLPSVSPQAKECCTSSFGQDRLAEAHALKAFELGQGAIEVALRGSFRNGASDRTEE